MSSKSTFLVILSVGAVHLVRYVRMFHCKVQDASV